MLTRIRNANFIGLQRVYIFNTKLIFSLVQILKKEGFLVSYKTFLFRSQKSYLNLICVVLKFKIGFKRKPFISFLKQISKPSQRVYISYKQIVPILNGVGVSIRFLILKIFSNLFL